MFVAKEEGPIHKNLVSSLVQHLESKGWEVTHAALDGYEFPEVVEKHRPDVKAKKRDENNNTLLAYGEAETCETINAEQTFEQIDEFSSRVMTKSQKPVPLYIVVPGDCMNWAN